MNEKPWWYGEGLRRHERTCPSAALPPVRSEPLLAVYDRFKHLDSVLEMVKDSDGTDNTDPFHMAARDLWRAIKASLDITTNKTTTGRTAQ